MSNIIKASLKVTINAFNKGLNEDASVVLTAKNKRGNQSEEILVKFSRLAGCFVAQNIQPGFYTIYAEAEGYEPQEREVNLNSGEHEETFVLGIKGMPFFYRGKVKVPFEVNENLIGVMLAGKNFRQHLNTVVEAADKLGLSKIETSSHINDNGALVFKMRDAAKTNIDEVLLQIEKVYGVKLTGPVVAFNKLSVSFLTRQIIIKFKSEVSKDRIPEIAHDYECQVIRTIPYIGNGWLFETFKPSSFTILEICEKLVNSNLVDYAEPNMAFTVVNDFIPNDFLYPQQGHHAVIGSEAAWDITRGNNSVIISVVDGGFDLTHPDFINPVGSTWTKVYSPFDFTGMDANPLGINHGVESSGIAAANGNNTIGISGLAQDCVLMPVQYPTGTDLNYSDAYIWVAGFNPHSTTAGFPAPISPGADVISNSFGIYQAAISGIMKDTFDYLTSYGRNGKGCIIVYSVGNDNVDFNNGGPGGGGRNWAAYSRTIAVAASTISPPDPAQIKSSTSNFGMNLDICAPGGNTGSQTRSISSYNVGGGTLAGSLGGASLDYGSFGQTSCACPQVSGTAALMLSVNPDLTWIQVKQILRNTASKIDFGNIDVTGMWVDLDGDGINEYSQWYGYGRVDAAAAVAGARDFIPESDIVVRDNLSDTGTVPSSSVYWQSPDVWVRQLDPATDGAAALPVNYMSNPPHLDADRSHDNWVYVRMKNTGTAASNSFYVRLYIVHWPGTEFVFPNDFIPTNNPGSPVPSPMTPGTYLIGESALSSLPAGTDSIINLRWEAAKIPPDHVMVGGVDVHWHPCLLVQITPADGPPPSGNHVWDSNNLIQRNITIVGMASDDAIDFDVATIVGNLNNSNAISEIEIDRGKLPSGVRLYVQVTDARVRDWIEKNKKKPAERVKGSTCELKVLEDTKAEIICSDENSHQKLELLLSRNSVVHLQECKPDNQYGTYKPGTYKGRKVFFLDDAKKVRIPMLRTYSKLMPVIIGGIIQSKPDKGDYEISINQYDHAMVVSGSYGIRLQF